ncbi:hypothetical protein GF351_01595 [Candidatus Woesearchaeota archaeon]|nr:hypothetical protein [Candidatus Woesearchaeota archaeon]
MKRTILAVMVAAMVILTGCAPAVEQEPENIIVPAGGRSYTIGNEGCIENCQQSCLAALTGLGMECDLKARSICDDSRSGCFMRCTDLISDQDACWIYCGMGSYRACTRNIGFACTGEWQQKTEYRSCVISCQVANC